MTGLPGINPGWMAKWLLPGQTVHLCTWLPYGVFEGAYYLMDGITNLGKVVQVTSRPIGP